MKSTWRGAAAVGRSEHFWILSHGEAEETGGASWQECHSIWLKVGWGGQSLTSVGMAKEP